MYQTDIARLEFLFKLGMLYGYMSDNCAPDIVLNMDGFLRTHGAEDAIDPDLFGNKEKNDQICAFLKGYHAFQAAVEKHKRILEYGQSL